VAAGSVVWEIEITLLLERKWLSLNQNLVTCLVAGNLKSHIPAL